MSCLQTFTTKEKLNNHRGRCLLINNTQTVKYETGIIKFKNYESKYLYHLKFMLIQNVY